MMGPNMAERYLASLPVFNEVTHVDAVLREVRRFSDSVLVIDDGSTDGTREIVSQLDDIAVVSHPQNRGYGAALRTAFEYAIEHDYDILVTIDCDGQHEPQRIPKFVKAVVPGVDIVSGSRYLRAYPGDSEPPAQRRWINQRITADLNRLLGFQLTDAFCGFKAYRVRSLRQLELTEDGYAMPLELWVQAACAGLQVVELPVPLIYLDEKRSFGGMLDDGETRIAYYHDVIQRSLKAAGMDRGPVPRAEKGSG
ncbi:MAG: glycosyltransferase family 2 protein [Planctomycetota bacterium]|nr:glycosyltransferase family 2 protein [Planctomycetota bacterium]